MVCYKNIGAKPKSIEGSQSVERSSQSSRSGNAEPVRGTLKLTCFPWVLPGRCQDHIALGHDRMAGQLRDISCWHIKYKYLCWQIFQKLKQVNCFLREHATHAIMLIPVVHFVCFLYSPKCHIKIWISHRNTCSAIQQYKFNLKISFKLRITTLCLLPPN